jgi:hypothetical protein
MQAALDAEYSHARMWLIGLVADGIRSIFAPHYLQVQSYT